jgi:aryl-alcohol dehydrogenase-like predicted oxidoreductase
MSGLRQPDAWLTPTVTSGLISLRARSALGGFFMEYRTLGRTGLKVSAIAMGTFTFGGVGPFGRVGNQGVPEARALVDLCIEHGVNLFDTANMYSAGRAEEILGEVLEGRRHDVLVTSKARMKIGPGPNDEGTSRFHLIRECERSLKRLRTDYIDIYYMHEWDGTTPVEEKMAALDTLVQQGKVRYVGCSNYSGWHVMKSLMASERDRRTRFVTQQIHYTIEAREAEYELLPISVDQGLGVLVWSPLAAGLLTGKHRRGQPTPEGTRQFAGWTEPPIRDAERLYDIIEVLVDVGNAHGVSAAQVALAWLLTRPAVSSLVVGGRTEAQFRDNIAAVSLRLSDADLARLNEVSKPPLIYPYWHQGQFARPRFSEADWTLHAGNEPPAW